MSAVIEQMLKSYNIENLYDRKNAMKEIMQEIVLCGLSRAGFFQKAAFYGGTALRIFYGLERFSEDLDFSLENTDISFDLASYFPVLEKEVRAFGLNVTIMEKEKTKESNIRSAFLKGNTKEHLLLFVGKIHAVICRAWQSRVKGRDLYDYVFYLSRGAAVNRRHLRERLIQSGFITADVECSLDEIKHMLSDRFEAIDFSQARRDVEPFIHDTSVLNIWSADFFKQITEGLTVC